MKEWQEFILVALVGLWHGQAHNDTGYSCGLRSQFVLLEKFRHESLFSFAPQLIFGPFCSTNYLLSWNSEITSFSFCDSFVNCVLHFRHIARTPYEMVCTAVILEVVLEPLGYSFRFHYKWAKLQLFDTRRFLHFVH